MGVFGDGREQVDEVAVGVAEQDGAVAPGHRRRLLHPLVDQRGESLVLAVDVVDKELNDHAVVVGGPRGVLPEQLGGT